MRNCHMEALEPRRLLSGATGTIWGTVYDDANANAMREASESGIAGVRVFLDVSGSGTFNSNDPSVITNGYGTYLFQNIPAGTYQVGQVLPAGYRQTSPVGELSATAVAGQIAHTGNFGDQQSVGIGTIWGTVFNDSNGNGLRDATEAGIPGVQVYLDLGSAGSYQSGDPVSITNSYGTYLFQNILAGTYAVRQIVPSGFGQSAPAGGAVSASVLAGQINHTGNFGDAPATGAPTGSIWGTVFSDLNSNGVRDSGEAGIQGVRVFIDLNGDGTWQSTEPSVITNVYGTYLFRDIAPGAYKLAQVLGAGLIQSSPAGDLTADAMSGLIVNTGNFGDAAATAPAGLSVTLGRYTLAHGASASFQIDVSDSHPAAAQDIEAMNFALQIGNGLGSTPSISSIDLSTGTIWAGHGAVVDSPSGGVQPQFQAWSVTTGSAGDYVTANGVLATITLDAAGAAPGNYILRLTNTIAPGWDTSFLSGNGDSLAATFATGLLTIT
jgi:uncharacterized protein (DUF2141 family)